jgi:enediyne biosynthesis protein E4
VVALSKWRWVGLKTLLGALVLCSFSFTDSDLDQGIPHFTDVSEGSGLNFTHVNGDPFDKDYIPEAKGGGIGAFDFDNDGLMDIYVAQGSTVEKFRKGDNLHGALFRNRGDGTFEDVTQKAGLTHRGWGMGVAFGDFDNDGFTDIYLTYIGPNKLYRNNGDGTFTDVTDRAGVGDPRWSTSAAFGDYDGDGLLDLYVSNYLTIDFEDLPDPVCVHRGNRVMCGPRGIPGASGVLYRNNGDGTFTDVTEIAGVVDREGYFSLGVVWADMNNNNRPDLFVNNDATPNLFFANRGDGTFEEMGFLSGLAVSGDGVEQAGMGVDVADYDNDGLLDLYSTHFAMEYNTLYRNQGDLIFEDVSGQAGIQIPQLTVSWSTRFIDFNNDGWKDIIHVNGHVYPYLLSTNLNETYAQPKVLYMNQRNGRFRDVSAKAGDLMQKTVSRGAAFADFDNDGDFDVVVATLNGSPQLLRNDRRDSNNWIMFRTVGRPSNRDGIGARITLNTGDLKQVWEIKRTAGIYSASDPRAHFGLGKAAKADQVSVRWPSGKSSSFEDVPSNFHYIIDEQEGLRREFP